MVSDPNSDEDEELDDRDPVFEEDEEDTDVFDEDE